MGTDDEMVNVPYDLVWELFDLVVDGADENMESVRMIAPLTKSLHRQPRQASRGNLRSRATARCRCRTVGCAHLAMRWM